MKKITFTVLLLILLAGCSAPTRPDRSYRNHVSDVESEDKIKGVTYDNGPAHPTFGEMVFAKLGIK